MPESILHFGAIRVRVVGDGNLKAKLSSLDDVFSQDLVPITMESASGIQPTRLANFNSQRALLEIKTTEFDEYFRINRIILFVKELYTSYPG